MPEDHLKKYKIGYGPPQLFGLPEDWFERHRKEVTVELGKVFQRCWCLGLARDVKESLIRSAPTLNDATLSLSSLQLSHAIHLVNKVAFCYTILPTYGFDRQERPVRNQSDYWIGEAHKIWKDLRPETSHALGTLPFAPVEVPREDSERWQNWPGMELKDSISEKNIPVVREAELDRLIERNARLCDMVQKRAHGPAEEMDEYLLERSLPRFNRMQWQRPMLLPTCRAVLLIAVYTLADAKTVMLVLTGQHEHLLSGPPTFADIPESEIVEVHGSRAVEVPFRTAIWFLACLEAAEESANEELRYCNSERVEVLGREELERADSITRGILEDENRAQVRHDGWVGDAIRAVRAREEREE